MAAICRCRRSGAHWPSPAALPRRCLQDGPCDPTCFPPGPQGNDTGDWASTYPVCAGGATFLNAAEALVRRDSPLLRMAARGGRNALEAEPAHAP